MGHQLGKIVTPDWGQPSDRFSILTPEAHKEGIRLRAAGAFSGFFLDPGGSGPQSLGLDKSSPRVQDLEAKPGRLAVWWSLQLKIVR